MWPKWTPSGRTTIAAVALLALAAAGFALATRAHAATTRASTDIQPYTAPTVTAVGSHTVTAVTSHAVTSVSSQGVKPYTSKTITVNKPALPPKPLAFYLRTWHLGVPGTSYVTPGAIGSSSDTLHTSAGTAARHTLTIRADHTWTWGSDTGRWQSSGRQDYPIELVRAYQGDDWYVGYDEHNDGRIFAWDKQADWWLYGKP